jgi:hypothetical protein
MNFFTKRWIAPHFGRFFANQSGHPAYQVSLKLIPSSSTLLMNTLAESGITKITNYNELQQTTTNYNKLQRITTNYNELQRITTNYNELQLITANYNKLQTLIYAYIYQMCSSLVTF